MFVCIWIQWFEEKNKKRRQFTFLKDATILTREETILMSSGNINFYAYYIIYHDQVKWMT